jgi:hypothetical protein
MLHSVTNGRERTAAKVEQQLRRRQQRCMIGGRRERYDQSMLIPNSVFQVGRIVIGAAFVAAPEAVGKSWIGDAANADGGIMARAFGGRDIALGAATLIAARESKTLAPMLALGVMVDTIDSAATLAAGDKIPDRARYVSAAVAAWAALNGFRLFTRARRGATAG